MDTIDFGSIPVPGFVAATGGSRREPTVRTYGAWPDAEIVDVSLPMIRLLIVGHFVTRRTDIAATFSTVAETGRTGLLDELPGAYAYLVLRRSGELTARGDDAGQYPLYYSCSLDETLVGTHAGVLGARHRREPDAITAAVRIACPNVLPLGAERSLFCGVGALEPGATLHAVAGDVHVDRADPADRPRLPRREVAPELRRELAEAVRRRTSGVSVSCDLSGGLDSTSLAFLAARSSGRPVHVITYRQALAPAQDLTYATAYAKLDAKFRHSIVTGTEDSLPYCDLSAVTAPGLDGDAVLAEEPAGAMVARSRAEIRLARAAELRSRLHMTGEGGDAVFGSPAAYLADVAASRSRASLFRLCLTQAWIREESPWLLFRRARRTAGTGARASLVGLAVQLEHPQVRQMRWSDCVAWWPLVGEAVNWLTGSMRATLADIAADPQTERCVPRGAEAADLQGIVEVRNSAAAQRYLRELGHGWGVPVHAPLLDNAIVRLCSRVRSGERWDTALPKPLLRTALEGLVPAAVFDRRTKGSYTGEDYLGARTMIHYLREIVSTSRLAELGVIEPARVMQSVERLGAGISAPMGALNQLVALEVWLHRLQGRGGAEGNTRVRRSSPA